jgi:signal transduction histidine kinase
MVLLGLLSWFLYGRIADQILSGAEAELIRLTRGVAEAMGRNPDRPDLVAFFVETAIGGADPKLRLAVELLDEDGNAWLRRGVLGPFQEPLPTPLPFDPGDGVLREVMRDDEHPYFEMVVPNGHGHTRASVYSGPFLRNVERLRNRILPAVLGTLMLTGLLGWWLARQSLFPIARIVESARRITAEPGGETIPVSGSGDGIDRLAMTLNEMLERIRTALTRTRRFTADAAHQLRTPLSVLQTRIEVILAKHRTPEEYRRTLTETLAEIERLGTEVHAILRLADSGGGLRPEQRQRVALGPLLQSVVEFFRPLAEVSGIHLSARISRDGTVLGDPASLRNLVANLVDNAIKYSKSGGSVELELTVEPGFSTVAVRDTGLGIEDADRERIFDSFSRGRRHESIQGIGLGLALVAEIARAHGGTIELESSDRGSTFKVRLPLAPPSDG